MDRFKVTRVSNKDINCDIKKIRNEISLNVGDLNNFRRNSRTVPANFNDRRKISLAQLTRYVMIRRLINILNYHNVRTN